MDTGDTAWVLMSTALVMLMTPALGFFYGGLVQRKNVLSTIMHSFFILALISVQWVLWGYSLAFAPGGSLIGGIDWLALRGVGQEPNADYAATIPALSFMAFQMMFAIITPALISGAFAERKRFKAMAIFSLLWATLVYAPVAHWVWGVGGWLRTYGALDFAGGTVVHITAGVAALVAASMLGKRIGFGQGSAGAAQPDLHRARRRSPLVRLVRVQRRQCSRREWSGGERSGGHQHRRGDGRSRLDDRLLDPSWPPQRARAGRPARSRVWSRSPRPPGSSIPPPRS